MLSNLPGRLAVLGVFFATFAEAQPQPPLSGSSPAWSVAAGYESFWLRDFARPGPPVDASPIAWEGEGPAVVGTYDRGRPGRLHHFEGSFASAGGFSLQTPVRSFPGPADDSAMRIGARYEYRRYPFRDLWMSGFDLGVGIEGSGDYLSFARHFQPAIELRTNLTNVGVAGVVAARFHRWPRVDLQAAWGNGGSIGRSTAHHRAAVETTYQEWGGGWQTNLQVLAAVRVAVHTSLLVSYLNSGEGRYASHDGITYGRSRFAVGVTFGQ